MADIYNFEADLKVLNTAASGINEAADSLIEHNVDEDWLPQSVELGRFDVSDAVSEFGNRWDLGLKNLTNDTVDAAAILAGIVGRYATFDEEAGSRMDAASKESGSTAWPKLGFGAR